MNIRLVLGTMQFSVHVLRPWPWGYMSSSVMRPHDSLYSISYRCFIWTHTNMKSVALTILELLAFMPKYSQGHMTLTMKPFQKFLMGYVVALWFGHACQILSP